MVVLSGLNATPMTPAVCPVSVRRWSPVFASQKTDSAVFTPACEGGAIRAKRYTDDPSRMPSECVEMIPCVDIPETDSVIVAPADEERAVRTKRYAVDRNRMSGECTKMEDRYSHPKDGWCGHQLPVARVAPSGLNATLATGPVCPVSVLSSLPVLTSQRWAVRSQLAVARVTPSG